jgi:hypothetical protein
MNWELISLEKMISNGRGDYVLNWGEAILDEKGAARNKK